MDNLISLKASRLKVLQELSESSGGPVVKYFLGIDKCTFALQFLQLRLFNNLLVVILLQSAKDGLRFADDGGSSGSIIRECKFPERLPNT